MPCGRDRRAVGVPSRPEGTLKGMTELITPRQFHEADGVEDWRVLFGGACAHFRTGSFAAGVALMDAIGRLADAANHHPDVDLRSDGVVVRLTTTPPPPLFFLPQP